MMSDEQMVQIILGHIRVLGLGWMRRQTVVGLAFGDLVGKYRCQLVWPRCLAYASKRYGPHVWCECDQVE